MGAVAGEGEPGEGDSVEGLGEVLAAVDAFDRALSAGLLRPRAEEADALAEFARSLTGTPLAARVGEAVEKVAAGAASEDHFLALAAARTALLGAAHDALLLRAHEIAGRRTPADTGARPDPAPGGTAPVLAAARSWLGDLARAGWQGIDHELISGAAPVVSAMLPDPALRRPATLLDGFATELAACCPGATLERVPLRRWADLWSRAMLLTVPGAGNAAATDPAATNPAATDPAAMDPAATSTPAMDTATGRLLPLGVDLCEHATAAQAQVHAVLEPADGSPPRLVRAAVSVPKPDTVLGAGVWQLMRPHMSLLAAVSEGRSMDLTGMPVTAEGDLVWSEEHARAGKPADAFATARVALPTATAGDTAPLDRHPARIAVPVFLEGYTARGGGDEELTFTVAGRPLAVDTDRIPVAGPLTPESVAASGACIGLLRWDAGRFRLQPLAVEATVRKKSVAVHAGGWAGGTADRVGAKAEKAATDAVAALRERAGRLLRK
ncbi:hypothetical protein ABZX40_39425 [Streptomyces sp. NPDC004610]|uniref:hypothetical protein n=1 Tax=unclassified Streptomyces TaxID=2593676 RepID=UPI0033A3E8CC